MWIELGIIVSAVVVICIVVGTLPEGEIAEDGGDDPGNLGLIISIYFSVIAVIVGSVLVGLFELVRAVVRVRRRCA